MGILDSIFGGKKEYVEDKDFTVACQDAFSRYMSIPGAVPEFEFKDKKGNILPLSVAFSDTYEEWKTIRSTWDKRGVIYAAFDKICLDHMHKWQIIERYTIDRYPQKAMKFVRENCSTDDFKNIRFATALSKCLMMASIYDMAKEYAETALGADLENREAKLILADLLHLTNQHEEAHRLYAELLKDGTMDKYKDKTLTIFDIVNFENQIMHSSVYAISLLTGSGADEAMWDKVAEEFYYCPYFRSQHAYYYIGKQENLKGLAKLVSVSQEFPAFQDGVVNAYSVIKQFQKQLNDDTFMLEDEQYLKKIMEAKNWTG
jgi:hypothetical protein